MDQATFADRLEAVEARVRRALERTGRQRTDIKLVAVTKKFSAGYIQLAYDSGLRDFGENYVQEFAEKRPNLGDLSAARFHLIGHLQSNKVRSACELFEVIETAHSSRILEKLNAAAREQEKRVEILLEIKLSDETSKSGATAQVLPELLAQARSCPQLDITGLMTVPPWSENPELSRPYFRNLAELARRNGLGQLSMGMSNDFEVAIEEGATILRIGTALFGPRPKPAAVQDSAPAR
ncbi:MAG: YggS family pyridoxal phosphate-dependent enzyme [Acidobacteriota bacterium]|nr:YggS family pyridoxal phosphate-dependent enzyme [Acidobacteriota bacterium]